MERHGANWIELGRVRGGRGWLAPRRTVLRRFRLRRVESTSSARVKKVNLSRVAHSEWAAGATRGEDVGCGESHSGMVEWHMWPAG